MLTFPDSKQARDLIGVLQESKQKIDPRLMEMARFGGGGGGGRGFGGRGRGGGFRGGRGSSYTGSNSAPLGGNRRW
jgi:ATP-dependent RNA helicase DDX5/DBP2